MHTACTHVTHCHHFSTQRQYSKTDSSILPGILRPDRSIYTEYVK